MTKQDLAIIEVKNLIPVAYADKEKFFLNENNEVQEVIDAVKNYYSNVIPSGMDATTEDGRKVIKKFAAELNNKIKEIDGIGKSVNDILKAKPNLIDAGRKVIKDKLGLLYESIRKPVLDWEAEQKAIKDKEEAEAAAEQQKKDEELKRLREEAAQRERDKQIAEAAANKAKLEAENKLNEAEIKLKQQQDEIDQKERERVAEEKRKQAEEAKRLSDVEHVRSVKNEAYSSLIQNGIDKETAINLVKLIADNKIDNVKIIY